MMKAVMAKAGTRGLSRAGCGRRTGSVRWLQTAFVGLPNVGKSSLFNAVMKAKAKAEAANFPFCTIDPNVGRVAVPDDKLRALGELMESEKVVPTFLEFVDVAGLVKGAADGEGLGNKFLSNIRECDAIVHVVRCFEDDDIIHVDNTIDAIRDVEVIELELALADLAQVERKAERMRKGKGKNSYSAAEAEAVDILRRALEGGTPARSVELDKEQRLAVQHLQLLTAKPMLYAANVGEGDVATGNEMTEALQRHVKDSDGEVIVVSAQVEAEIAEIASEDERTEFIQALGVTDAESLGLPALIKAAYRLLDLRTHGRATRITGLTIPAEPPRAGLQAPFIQILRQVHQAETMAIDDLFEHGSSAAVKEAGLLRSHGRDYIVSEGDVILFRHGA